MPWRTWPSRRAGSADAIAELADAFAGRLEFGTAGLRGALGPGPNRMNRVVVGQAAAGLAALPEDHGLSGGRVIIGYDARHNSDVFAADTAEIMAGRRLRRPDHARPLPTPVLAFGIGHFGCVAGVVVTASHNPPQDNGYKVYLGTGRRSCRRRTRRSRRDRRGRRPPAWRRAAGGRLPGRSATSWSTRTWKGSPDWCRRTRRAT